MRKKLVSMLFVAAAIIMTVGTKAQASGTQHLYSSKGILSIKVGDNEVFLLNTNELQSMYTAGKNVYTKMQALKTNADNASSLLVQTINLKNSATTLKATAADGESLNDLVLKTSYLGLQNAVFKYGGTYYRITDYSIPSDGYLYGSETVYNSDTKRMTGCVLTVKASATALSDSDITTYKEPGITGYDTGYAPISISSYGIFQNDTNGDARTATVPKTDKKYMELYFDAGDFKTLNSNLTSVENKYRQSEGLFDRHKDELITVLYNRNVDVSEYDGKNIDNISFTDVINKISKISVANGNTTNFLHTGDGGYAVTKNDDGTFKLTYKMK